MHIHKLKLAWGWLSFIRFPKSRDCHLSMVYSKHLNQIQAFCSMQSGGSVNFYFNRVTLYAILRNYMSEEIHFSLEERAFLSFKLKIVFLKSPEYGHKVVKYLFKWIAKNDLIIKMFACESFNTFCLWIV